MDRIRNPDHDVDSGRDDRVAVKPRYSPAEEVANWTIHGLGLVLALFGLVILSRAFDGDPGRFWGGMVFALALILLYATSTAYHAVRDAVRKAWLRTADHAAIFVLIAGTYTPFMLVNLRGPWGWTLLVLIWALALFGVVLELTRLHERRAMAVALYLIMGWLVVVATGPMLERVAPAGLWLLLAGGLCYTGGVGFYLWRSLPFHHAIWHAFVLAGSVLHFLAVLFFAVPYPVA